MSAVLCEPSEQEKELRQPREMRLAAVNPTLLCTLQRAIKSTHRSYQEGWTQHVSLLTKSEAEPQSGLTF